MILYTGQEIHPFFRSNADVLNCSGKDRGKTRECGEIELDALECLEAYGARRGQKLCQTYVQDYKECMRQFIQLKRVAEMKRERVKQVMRGERKFFETYDNIQPPRDSFQWGPFYN